MRWSAVGKVLEVGKKRRPERSLEIHVLYDTHIDKQGRAKLGNEVVVKDDDHPHSPEAPHIHTYHPLRRPPSHPTKAP